MPNVIHSHITAPLYKTITNNHDCSPPASEAAILQHGEEVVLISFNTKPNQHCATAGREGQGRECHGVCYQHRAPFPAKQSNIYSICTDRSPPMAVGWKENRRAAISGKRRMFQLRAEADALSSFLPVSCQLLTCFERLKTTDPVTIENKARLSL